MFEKFFKLKENGTTVKTEVIAGLTTFVTMAYIIFVNPDMIATGASIVGGDYNQVLNGVFFATCISAFIGTFLMAVYAKIPFAQAPGMGLNALFAFTMLAGFGMTYSQGLGIVLMSGILFIVITFFGLREAIVAAIPVNIKIAISAGIGLFLAFLGLQSSGLVVKNDSTLVALVDFSKIGSEDMNATVMKAIVAFIGIIVIAALYKLNVKGAILIGIVVSTVVGIPLGVTAIPALNTISFDLAPRFGDFMEVSFMKAIPGFVSIFEGKGFIEALSLVIMFVISFSLVDMFDTIGTLLGTASKANLLDKDGNMPQMKQALMCDAIATTAGALLGTSTVTTFVESSAGIGEGGKTGLTSLVTSFMFLGALILAPFIGIVPGAATAPALIFVGALMMSSIKDIDFDDMSEAVPAFLTIGMMPFTYSIANGIAIGLISYVFIKALSMRFKDIKPLTVILVGLFLVRYFVIG